MISLTGYKLEKPEIKINYRQIDDHLQNIAKQYERWIKVDEPLTGDRIHVDIAFKAENINIEEYEDKFLIGGGRADAAFENVILGMHVGETKESEIVTVDNPRKLWVRIKLRDVERKLNVPIDDKLIRRATHFRNLASYKKFIKARLERKREDAIQESLRNQLFEQLAYRYPDTPINEEELQKLVDPSHDTESKKLLAEFKASQHLKALEILMLVAQQENCVATEKEFKKYIVTLSHKANKTISATLEMVNKDRVMRYLSQLNAINLLLKYNV